MNEKLLQIYEDLDEISRLLDNLSRRVQRIAERLVDDNKRPSGSGIAQQAKDAT